jgi:urease accessory protein
MNESVALTPTSSSSPGWQAELRIDLGVRAGRTRPTFVSHRGPLRVQRPFYPEDDHACHVVLLHPPGGVVGGDQLHIAVDVMHAAHALLTTPAATKIYRSGSGRSTVTQEISGRPESCVEWLPQETIVFPRADAELQTIVRLEGNAQFIGWEVLCLGRPAISEVFDEGRLVQRLSLWRDDRPLYLDRLAVGAGGDVRGHAWGIGHSPVIGTMLIAGATEMTSSALREVLSSASAAMEFSCTQLEGVSVVRYLGPSVPNCWRGFNSLWDWSRKKLGRGQASPPRIWKC